MEAISPTPNPQDEPADGVTKDDLLNKISQVDLEINKATKSIEVLQKKLATLEVTKKTEPVRVESPEVQQPKHRSLAHKIFAENRNKAERAHSVLKDAGPPIELPLNNQPSDVRALTDIANFHREFKPRLIASVRQLKSERWNNTILMAEKYNILSQQWLRRVEKIESTAKRKAKDAKNREFFEKVFTELRKQREDKERFNRVGSRVKSEAEVEEIIDGLQEQVPRSVCYSIFHWLMHFDSIKAVINLNTHIFDLFVTGEWR